MTFPIATPRYVQQACAHLARVDPDFARTIDAIGIIRIPPPSADHFAYLVRSIIYQQLAGRAAETIHRRLVTLLEHDVSPQRLITKSSDELRSVGVSKNKFLALYDLAERTLNGALPLDSKALARLHDEVIIQDLSEVRGIGPWTAQMFLMSQLRRLDVWPTGDLGVRRGYGLIHGYDSPTPKELMAAGESLRPYRSVAAIYCWRAIDFDRAQRNGS